MEENQIVNPNADGQESAPVAQNESTEATTASTNEPAAETVVSQGIAKEPVQETVAAHDDFDWSIDKRNVTSYTQEEKEKYDKVYDRTFVQLSDGE
jgi:small subunit ribosomal protein S1